MGTLVYLRNTEIDRQKWDECINEAPQGVIFALSWYLDFCESEWEAVVEMEGGRYITVMPFQLRRKYGFKYVHQDPYSFVLGVFSVKKFQQAGFFAVRKRSFWKVTLHRQISF